MLEIAAPLDYRPDFFLDETSVFVFEYAGSQIARYIGYFRPDEPLKIFLSAPIPVVAGQTVQDRSGLYLQRQPWLRSCKGKPSLIRI